MQILAKAEFLNPGGSVKDRVALHIIRDAFAQGLLQEGGLITEGTAGSTGLQPHACLASPLQVCFTTATTSMPALPVTARYLLRVLS